MKIKKHKELGGTSENFLDNEKKTGRLTEEQEKELIKFLDEYDKI